MVHQVRKLLKGKPEMAKLSFCVRARCPEAVTTETLGKAQGGWGFGR
jgi:hypothetical protein